MTFTVHVPAPPPASVERDGDVLLLAPGFSRPNETLDGAAKTSGAFARARSIRPPPSFSGVPPVVRAASMYAGSPVCISADLTCATVHVGCRCLRSAAAPATCGEAMLVPLNAAQVPSRAGTDETTLTPGAVTSGLSWSEYGVGPIDEKPARMSGAWPRPVVDAAAVIASGALPGEPTEPLPAASPSLPAAMHGIDARERRAVDRLDDDVARRLDLGLAEREVDHVHAVRDRLLDRLRDLRRVAVEPEARRRDRQRLVVADVRGGRDARTAIGWPANDVAVRAVVARGDAGDVRAVLAVLRIEREVRVLPLRRRRRERARDDHLRRREGGVRPSGIPRAS